MVVVLGRSESSSPSTGFNHSQQSSQTDRLMFLTLGTKTIIDQTEFGCYKRPGLWSLAHSVVFVLFRSRQHHHHDVHGHFVNDPSAGSPTETLLRLLLPLNDPAWTSFRLIPKEQCKPLPPTRREKGPLQGRQSNALTRPFNR